MADPVRFDGITADELAARLDLPRVVLLDSVSSTLDVAHALGAEQAPAGTLVLADTQTAGRGRGGHQWSSPAGRGLWLTLLERPADVGALQVLAIRLGTRAARVLDRFAPDVVRLKWPNDLMLEGRKLGGILVEARWREGRPEWAAVGFGLNVVAPADVPAAGLRPGTSRLDVLAELVPALRAAATARGALAPGEIEAYAERDWARGRRCRQPTAGVVQGIDRDGALVVATGGIDVSCRVGSLVFEEEA